MTTSPAKLARLVAALALGLFACAPAEPEPVDPPPALGAGTPHEEVFADLLRADAPHELLALYPYGEEPRQPGERFHRFRVIGSTTDVDPSEWRSLLALLDQGLREAGRLRGACYMPRHGIRTEVDGEPLELSMCFQCSYMHVHTKRTVPSGFKISDSVEPAVTAIFERAGLTIQRDDEDE